MSVQQFASVLRDQVRKDMNNYADDIAGGACRSFEEYQKLVGVIQGLALAESYLVALLEKVDKSDE